MKAPLPSEIGKASVAFKVKLPDAGIETLLLFEEEVLSVPEEEDSVIEEDASADDAAEEEASLLEAEEFKEETQPERRRTPTKNKGIFLFIDSIVAEFYSWI